MRLLAFGALMLLAGMGAGCSRGTDPAGGLTPEKLKELQLSKEREDPILRTQVDAKLEAQMTRPEAVQVTVENRTQRPMAVGPKFFGLILPGQRQVLTPDPTSRKSFPVSTLEPGDQAAGELVFAPGQLAAGARLVFNNPEFQPAMTLVR